MKTQSWRSAVKGLFKVEDDRQQDEKAVEKAEINEKMRENFK